MDRRDLSIILIFLMLAIGGGMPQAVHWKVDHGCCGTACAIPQKEQIAAAHFDCCPHHHHAPDQPSEGAGRNADARADAKGESTTPESGSDAAADEHPLNGEHDCSICQFLATLAAVVSPTMITPVHVDPVEWRIGEPVTFAYRLDRTSSHGPRAPPRFI